MKEITPVILCGGIGARLWPLSRDHCPKQFQPANGPGSASFFQDTINRHRAEGFATPWVVTGAQFEELVRDQLDAIGSDARILLEPVSRNTGPAALAAAIMLRAENPKAIMVLVPSDHVIKGEVNGPILSARTAALSGHIITFGVTPNYPETGYGYVVDGGVLSSGRGLRRVERFVEKPSARAANQLIHSGRAYWASGLSLFTAETLVREFQKLAPETAQAVQNAVSAADTNGPVTHLAEKPFVAAQAAATERVIFQNSHRMLLAPLPVAWNDIGSWSALHAIGKHDAEGNLFQGDVMAFDTRNSLVQSGSKLVAVVGMSDAIVVDTDDALLVARQESCQDVKKLVQSLRRAARPEAAGPLRDTLPTKTERELDEGHDFDVRTLTVKEDQSFHLDGRGEQHLIVLGGCLDVDRAGKVTRLNSGDRLVLTVKTPAHVSNSTTNAVQCLLLTRRNADSAQTAKVTEKRPALQ